MSATAHGATAPVQHTAHKTAAERSAAPLLNGADAKGTYGAQVPQRVGASTMMGAAVGVAARRLSSDALYGAGLCLACLQCLSYLGFITIHWNVISAAVTKAVDQNGDGTLDIADVRVLWRRLTMLMTRGLPDAAGFASGFLCGYGYLA
ncbi:FUN14 family [Novymonas esmeraldas]|uniref:FUN14 family n=1 Tax=Novymonas esmeraldas TaxID=1808958 RepID=A0AAW0EN27_9TRYP